MVNHACNPSATEQAEAGDLCEFEDSLIRTGSSGAHGQRNETAGVRDPGHHGQSLGPVSVTIGTLSLSEHVKEG